MKAPDCLAVDFETFPIQRRPHYPPAPVGVALQYPHEQPHYWSWGHPTGNNCTLQEGRAALHKAWRSGLRLLFHHSKFDLAVACERLDLLLPSWERVEDTVFLSFLANPHAADLGLKELAEDLLNWPPEERDAVVDWIMDHADELPRLPNKKGELCKPSRNQRTKDGVFAGAWIAYAPGDIVGAYACGDVARTVGLHSHLWPLIHDNGMGAAYNRERRLTPIFMENEQIGMRVNMNGLAQDVEGYGWHMDMCEDWLRRELQDDALNFDEDIAVAEALLSLGIVPEENWTRTKPTKNNPAGRLSVSKDNLLPEHFTGPSGAAVASALGYRNRLKTCLDMFMRPWLKQAEMNNAHITTNWNQTRGYEGGTRSGRPSTNSHNFLNLSKSFDGKDDGYVHPAFLSVAPLPLVRKYVLPDVGGVFLHRDFDGQEMRVFAHVECGALQEQYRENPKLDPHDYVGQELMAVAAREIPRTNVKALNFQGLYGGGVPALQRKLRVSYSAAKELKAFHDRALPGRAEVVKAIKALVQRGEPIRTWGGRLYWCEEPRVIDGRMRSMDYKLINYYCQGSAADITKQALIEWHAAKKDARFMVTVYDEINLSAPAEVAAREMAFLREVMEAPRLCIDMLSSPKHGLSWGDSKECKGADKKRDPNCEVCNA